VTSGAACHNTAIVVMGVSGAGKTTIGTLLAARLGRAFLEGDSFHPQGNIVKMRSAVPLDDADRRPWLEAIAAAIDSARREGRQVVVTCSALKRTYRALLSDGHDDVLFVYLRGGKPLIAERLATRAGHFMPPQLLDSQFATLEEPVVGEPSIVVDIEDTPERIVQQVAERLAADVRT
jgi:carbohydrate kinase (thermoresistant glucokinase family)